MGLRKKLAICIIKQVVRDRGKGLRSTQERVKIGEDRKGA